MKQRLLSVAAALALTVGAFAQSWTAPVAPDKPLSPAEALMQKAADPVDGGNYYIMNVGEGQFLTGANVWATQISLTSNATPSMQITTVLQQTEDNRTFVFQRTNDAADKFYGDHGRENGYNPPAGRNHLFRSGSDGYVDMNNQGGDWFTITKNNETGYYYIQSSIDQGAFENAANEYAGGTGAGLYVKFTCTIEDPNIEWIFLPVESIDLDVQQQLDDYLGKMEIYNAAFEYYTAQLNLYTKLNEAVKYGVDYAAASAVYTKADPTLEELNAAYAAIAPAVNRAIVLASISESSEENPIEITDFVLVNPDFTQGNVDGWTVAKMGENLGYQNNQVYTTEETGVSLNQFIEAWYPTSSGALGDGGLSQSLIGLPAGRYRLECDAIASWQESNETEVTGVYLYYDNGSYIIHSEQSLYTLNGKPQHFEFEFDYDGADAMTIGLMTKNTNANWVAADNFKLFAIGEVQTPATYTALSALLNDASEIFSNVEYAQAALKNACEQAIATATDLVQSTPDKDKTEQYQNAYTTLSQATEDLRASIAAYKNFAALIEKMEADDLAYADKAGYEEYVSTIEDLLDPYTSALENGTYTTEQIEQAIADFQPLLKATVKKAFDDAVAAGQVLAEPLDITVLFDEMEIPYTTSQAAYEGEIWKEANNDGNFKTNYGTAEVWNSHSFNVYRELQLPAGKYTVTAKGFYREADNASNYSNYLEDNISGFTYLYAGNGQKQLTNVAAIAPTEAPATWNSPAEIEVEEGVSVFIPNNQFTAHEVFTDKDFAEKCLTSVSTVLSADGALRFGIKGDGLQDNQWSVWADFHIYFNVAQASDLDPDIESLIAQVEPMLDEIEIEGLNGPGGVAMGKTKLSDALAQGKAALNSDNADVKNAAITALNEALAYAEKSIELGVKITNTFSDYQEKENQLDHSFVSNYEGFATLMNDIETAMYDEAFESNEQIEGWIEALSGEWLNYILGWTALDAATIDNPVDLTTIIENADFSATDHTQGWTIETEATSGNRGTYENEFLEFWNVNAGWKIYQDLPKLREGFYTLQVDGCYRAAGTTAATDSLKNDNVKQNVIFFAGTMSTPLMAWTDAKGAIFSKLADAQNEYPDLTGNQFNYVVENDTTFFTAPNNRAQMLSFTNIGRYANSLNFGYTSGSFRFGLLQNVVYDNDWTPFGHFRLYYLGTEAPDAVKSIDAADASILAGKEIYNLAGQKVGKAQKGIYIIGGRKVVVK
ncbi:MAG: hypothetical protein IKR98_07700 [Bacteroidaceae bacterium]|nr:hypothetical protein [Bacteroidaceae bacterium]